MAVCAPSPGRDRNRMFCSRRSCAQVVLPHGHGKVWRSCGAVEHACILLIYIIVSDPIVADPPGWIVSAPAMNEQCVVHDLGADHT